MVSRMGWQAHGSWDDWLVSYPHYSNIGGNSHIFLYVHFFIFGEDSEFWRMFFFEMGFKPPTRITLYKIATWTLKDPCFHWSLGPSFETIEAVEAHKSRRNRFFRFFQTDRTCNWPLWAWPQQKTHVFFSLVYCKTLERKQLGIRSNEICILIFSLDLYLGSTWSGPRKGSWQIKTINKG